MTILKQYKVIIYLYIFLKYISIIMNKILLYIFRTLEYGLQSIKRGWLILFIFSDGVACLKIGRKQPNNSQKGLIIP